jgi:hypothetical protein
MKAETDHAIAIPHMLTHSQAQEAMQRPEIQKISCEACHFEACWPPKLASNSNLIVIDAGSSIGIQPAARI